MVSTTAIADLGSYFNVRTGKECRITVGDRKRGSIPDSRISQQFLPLPFSDD